MASLSFTQFHTLSRWHSTWPSSSSIKFVQLQDLRLQSRFVLTAVSKKKIAESLAEEASGEVVEVEKKTTRKNELQLGVGKAVSETPEEISLLAVSDGDRDEATVSSSASSEGSKKPQRRTRKKVASTSSSQ